MVKALVLLSGGIDSPVAAHICIKEGFELDYLHFDNYPHADKNHKENVRKIAEYLSDGKFISIPYADMQDKISNVGFPDYHCIMCKRFMFAKASELAKGKYDFIVTGDNLAQVASQTLNNMRVIDQKSYVPVLRPLLTWNKQEIVDYARSIGTYKMSKNSGCGCTLAPKSPATNGNDNIIKKIESKLKNGD